MSCLHNSIHHTFDGLDIPQSSCGAPATHQLQGHCRQCGESVSKTLSPDAPVSLTTLSQLAHYFNDLYSEFNGRVQGKCRDASTAVRDRLHTHHQTPAVVRDCLVDGVTHWVCCLSPQFVREATAVVCVDPTAGQFPALPETVVTEVPASPYEQLL